VSKNRGDNCGIARKLGPVNGTKCIRRRARDDHKCQERRFNKMENFQVMLSNNRFFESSVFVTEADIQLFSTFFHFGAVYGQLFKAFSKFIALGFHAIAAWMRDIYSLPGVR
jgi:glutathionyl-hydroquinone reductase